MSDLVTRVIVGNVVLYPGNIKQYLAKSCYFLLYDPEGEKLTLNANHGGGGQILFEIRNASHESAVKLAEGLGLEADGESPVMWSKWNPVLRLHHDGNADTETLRLEMLRLGIPHTIRRDSKVLGLQDGQHLYQLPLWTPALMLQFIREIAKKYEKELATAP